MPKWWAISWATVWAPPAQVVLVAGQPAVGLAEDRDAVGHHRAVADRTPTGEADPLVEPEQRAAVTGLGRGDGRSAVSTATFSM
jgi:hypothetical protein